MSEDPAGAPPGRAHTIDPFIRTPYAMAWNLGIKQLLPGDIKLSVDYVGLGSRKLSLAVHKNLAVLGSGSIASRRPIHNASIFTGRATEGNSNYHSLQVKLERSFKSGLTFLNLFTWSKSFDTVSDSNTILGPPGYTYNKRLSYGLSDFNAPVTNITL